MTFIDFSTLTWVDARRVGPHEDTIGLIPVAAIEQHGPHLPVSTDFLIAADLARRVAQALVETVIVTPVMPGGLSSHHTQFPGTVDLREAVFEGVLDAYIEAFARMGVRRVAVISGHGGNWGFLSRYDTPCPDVQLACHYDAPGYIEAMTLGARRAGLDPLACDMHAGLVETSQMLAIAPQLVRDFAGLEGYTANEPGFSQKAREHGLRSLSDTGILGRPDGATPGAGEEILAAIATALARWVADALDCRLVAECRLAVEEARSL
jgi:creatinine amidohydrolase